MQPQRKDFTPWSPVSGTRCNSKLLFVFLASIVMGAVVVQLMVQNKAATVHRKSWFYPAIEYIKYITCSQQSVQQKEEVDGEDKEEVIVLPQNPGGPVRDHPFHILPSPSLQGVTSGTPPVILSHVCSLLFLPHPCMPWQQREKWMDDPSPKCPLDGLALLCLPERTSTGGWPATPLRCGNWEEGLGVDRNPVPWLSGLFYSTVWGTSGPGPSSTLPLNQRFLYFEYLFLWALCVWTFWSLLHPKF